MNNQDRPAPPQAAHVYPAHHSRRPALQRRRTAAHTRPESRTGHPRREETIRRPRDHTLSPEDPTRGVKPTAAETAVNHDDPERANLGQEDPLVQPDKARPRNTLHQRLSVGHADGKGVDLPGACNGHPTHMG